MSTGKFGPEFKDADARRDSFLAQNGKLLLRHSGKVDRLVLDVVWRRNLDMTPRLPYAVAEHSLKSGVEHDEVVLQLHVGARTDVCAN